MKKVFDCRLDCETKAISIIVNEDDLRDMIETLQNAQKAAEIAACDGYGYQDTMERLADINTALTGIYNNFNTQNIKL